MEWRDDLFLTPQQLVDRYQGLVSLARLQKWRSERIGPCFTKIGGLPMYLIDDVETWERRNRISTNGTAPRTIAPPQKPAEGGS